MKLRDIEGRFLGHYSDADGKVSFAYVDALQDAQGVMFVCPKCLSENGGKREGVHSVICWFAGRVPDSAQPGPGRWNPQGSGLDDLSFVGPGNVSVQLLGGCGWHGFVSNGGAQ